MRTPIDFYRRVESPAARRARHRARRYAHRVLGAVHAQVLRRWAGKYGGRVRGMPVLILTTTGRRSGRQRVTPIAYWPYREGWTVIGTNAGSDRHPGWVLNLRADKACTVEVDGRQVRAVGSEAVGEERERIWEQMTRVCPRYEDLAEEASASRSIPVVVFRPALE